MLMLTGLLVFIVLILIVLPLFISFKASINRDMCSPFECGFDPYHSSRIPFSLQFFLIAVIFLIFDIEITFLLPLPMIININYPLSYLFISMSFIVVLLLGTYYEWYTGALSWRT